MKKKNLNIDNHRDFKISHEKIIKHSIHNNLKYFKKLNFRNHSNIN